MNVIKSSVVKKSICLLLVTAFIIVLAIPFYATQDNLRWVQLTAVSVTFEPEGQLYRISGSAGSSDPNGRIDLNVELQKKENGVWTVQSGSTWHSNGVMSAYAGGLRSLSKGTYRVYVQVSAYSASGENVESASKYSEERTI